MINEQRPQLQVIQIVHELQLPRNVLAVLVQSSEVFVLDFIALKDLKITRQLKYHVLVIVFDCFHIAQVFLQALFHLKMAVDDFLLYAQFFAQVVLLDLSVFQILEEFLYQFSSLWQVLDQEAVFLNFANQNIGVLGLSHKIQESGLHFICEHESTLRLLLVRELGFNQRGLKGRHSVCSALLEPLLVGLSCLLLLFELDLVALLLTPDGLLVFCQGQPELCCVLL